MGFKGEKMPSIEEMRRSSRDTWFRFSTHFAIRITEVSTIFWSGDLRFPITWSEREESCSGKYSRRESTHFRVDIMHL